MSTEIKYKKLRKQLKLSKKELAAAIGEAESRIWLLEEGLHQRIAPKIVERITKKLLDLCEKKKLSLL